MYMSYNMLYMYNMYMSYNNMSPPATGRTLRQKASEDSEGLHHTTEPAGPDSLAPAAHTFVSGTHASFPSVRARGLPALGGPAVCARASLGVCKSPGPQVLASAKAGCKLKHFKRKYRDHPFLTNHSGC